GDAGASRAGILSMKDGRSSSGDQDKDGNGSAVLLALGGLATAGIIAGAGGGGGGGGDGQDYSGGAHSGGGYNGNGTVLVNPGDLNGGNVLVVEAAAPEVIATIDGMSLDTGLSSGGLRFVTNNGAAGRTVYGSLSGALAAGESIVVSFDNGATWVAATVNDRQRSERALPVWSAVDPSEHAENWVIHAKVINADNKSSPPAMQHVVFDNTNPTATTQTVGMEHDTGIAGDFITNHRGSKTAGRLVHGWISEVLPSDERVQISFDNGVTWDGIQMMGSHAWSAVDQTEHHESWAMHTRVIDAAGNISTPHLQGVTLDVEAYDAPVISKIDFKNGSFLVSLREGQLGKGDTLRVNWGENQFRLTISDIDKNGAYLAEVPKHLLHTTSTPVVLSVSVIDVAGNESMESPWVNEFLKHTVTISGMTRDTGRGRDGISDWITSDIQNRRVIYGALENSLQEGEKLRVSLDGGLKWHTAEVRGTDWVYATHEPLSQGKTIQAQVVNQLGQHSLPAKSDPVQLDNSSSYLFFLKLDSAHQMLNCIFHPGSMPSVGDTLNVWFTMANGSKSFVTHSMTEQDLKYEIISLRELPPAVFAKGTVVVAQMEDIAGNLSNVSYTTETPSPLYATDIRPVKGTPCMAYGDNTANVFTLFNVNASNYGDYELILNGGPDNLESHQSLDTLKLSKGVDLDLTALNSVGQPWGQTMHSIEIFDLRGEGKNQLTLSVNDVLSVGSEEAFGSSAPMPLIPERVPNHYQIKVQGDYNDKLSVKGLVTAFGEDLAPGDSQWIKVDGSNTPSGDPSITAYGIKYDIYRHHAYPAELLVQTGLPVEFL
ncbi:hypothetical protein QN374_16740, partial [Herbaspirillum sp. RTI4]